MFEMRITMAGKRKIAYPIDLPFKTCEPVFLDNAQDKYLLNKEKVDKLIDVFNGTFRVGYVKRDRKLTHGINAHSINEILREKLKSIDGIEGETNVVFGSFLPPIQSKGEFDFSIFDEASNFYNFWNYCYGKTNAIRDGDSTVDYYIRDSATKEKWNLFIETQKPRRYEDDLVMPDNIFNVIGEIQFGNWAMVYKDMFRLVSAINKRARIDLYVYVVATGNLLKLMSDGVVSLEDACNRFRENVENHNINRPVMIIPLDLGLEIEEFDFSEAEEGYESVCSQIDFLEKRISKKKQEISKLKSDNKNLTGVALEKNKKKIVRAQRAKSKAEEDLAVIKNIYKDDDTEIE